MTDNCFPVIEPLAKSTGSWCPDWCTVTHNKVNRDLHLGERAELTWTPANADSPRQVLLAEIMQSVDSEEDELADPIVWAEGFGHLELDGPSLETFIALLEKYVFDLRGVHRRWQEIVRRVPSTEADDLPLVERTMPCPPWCSGWEREEDGSPAKYLVDRGHCSHPYELRLRLEPAEYAELSLEQPAFSQYPEIALTLQNKRGHTYCRFSLDDARQLSDRLSILLDEGTRHSTPGWLPPLSDVLASVHGQVYEDPRLAADAKGYVLGDLAPQGKVWVGVPKELAADRHERLVRELLGGLSDSHRLAKNPTPALPIATDEGAALPKLSEAA